MRAFSSPPLAFAPQVAWLWNGRLRQDTLLGQLQALLDTGCGGVVMRPTQGYPNAYLSDDWLQLVRTIAQECESRGLALWIGDDEGASGTCGGQIPAQRPDLASHYLRFQIHEVARGEASSWRLPPTAGRILYSLAMPLLGNPPRPDFTHAATLTNVAPERAAELVAALGADTRIFTFSQERDGYVDLLNPEVARLFLENTHERYRAALGGVLSNAVAGFFVSHPTLWDPAEAHDAQRFPWSPHLRDFFTRHVGYDPTEWLPALIAEFGDDAARFRQDFWQTIVAMAGESFYKPLERWAQAQGVAYTGIIRGQEPLNSMVAQQGDAVPVYRVFDQPGVAAQQLAASHHTLSLGRGLDARLTSSVAALQGKPYVMAEAWTGCGWSATLQDRVESLHHLFRQGVNRVVPHGAFYTIRGQRQRANAPSEWHQPYWAQWKTFADYIGRCSYALARGKPGARIGLLWPARSAWCHHHPRGHRLTRWVEEDFYASALLLDEINFDFLLLPEDDLTAARCEESRLLCGAAALPLEMVVLPSVTALSWNAWRKLEEFVAHGGMVVCLGLLPRWSERGRDREFETHVGKTLSLTIADLYESYAIMENRGQSPTTVGYPITREDTSGGRWSSYQPRLNADIKDAFLRVRKLLKDSLTPELETQATDILYTRRLLEEVPEEETPETEPEASAPAPLNDFPSALMAGATAEAGTAPATHLYEEIFDWDRPFDWDDEDGERAPGADPAHASASSSDDALDAERSADYDMDASAALLVQETPIGGKDYLNSGGDLYFIYNAAAEQQRVNLRLRPARPGTPHLLDAWTGDIVKLPVWMPFSPEEGGGLSLSLDLAALEAKLIWMRPAANPDAPPQDNIERATFEVESFDGRVASGYATESGAHRIAVRRDNRLGRYQSEPVTVPAPILFEDSWTAVRRGPNVLLASDWQWQHGRNELGSHRWFGAEKWRPMPSRETPPAGAASALENSSQIDLTGIVTFLTTFHIAESPTALFLQFDPLDAAYKLYLNGEPLSPCAAPYPSDPQWSDPEWQWYDLSVGEIGKNTLACLVDYRERVPSANPLYQPDLMPEVPRLVGDFSLGEDNAIRATMPMLLSDGSWHEQGLPFYSGAVEYRQWITVPSEWDRCRVFLEMAQMRDVAAVWMNGRACGVRVTAPYRFDVTRRLLKGAANEVRLRVWNTAEATLEGHLRPPQPSGLLGPVRLVAYPIVYPMVEAKATA